MSPPSGSRVSLCDPSKLQGQAVRQRHVAIETTDKYRSVRRKAIDQLFRGHGALPFTSGQRSWSQSPPVIQRPAGSLAANA